MRVKVDGADIFVSTGGRPFDPAGDVLLFIHGSGQSHLSWLLQARFFANRGWSVLAPDLPGHNLSGGEALATIEEMADWCTALLDAIGVEKAIVIGHSQGGLIALEVARRHPGRTLKLAILGSAHAIPVAEPLLNMARDAEDKAFRFMVSWSHATEGHRHDHTVPGQSHLLLGHQVMGQNKPGVLRTDLLACNAYKAGKEAAAAISCPALLILAERDRMVPKKFGLELGAMLTHSRVKVIPDAGHFLQSEKSVETNSALRPFFLE